MKYLNTLTFIFATILSNAQPNSLIINPNIFLPKDSIERKILTTALNEFLIAIQKSNEENKFVYENEEIETFILLDEIKGIEKSDKYKDDFFYKPYLNNLVPLKNNKYLVQISYIGTNENVALLRASFEFIAHKVDNSFRFSSPLKKNTTHWKELIIGKHSFHYETVANKKKIKEFIQLSRIFDEKLNIKDIICKYYLTDNIVEAQKLVGVNYKSDYNGITQGIFNSSNENNKLIILGNDNSTFDNFDPHDLWHDKLSLVISRSKVYKPVDEAYAYLYGGSWGISWKEIFKIFKQKVASNKNTDWKEIKENPLNFGESQEKHLMADYVVNALIIKKIENEKGFAGVWELLNCGKWESGNNEYYQILEKLTGITKENYNVKIWELINTKE